MGIYKNWIRRINFGLIVIGINTIILSGCDYESYYQQVSISARDMIISEWDIKAIVLNEDTLNYIGPGNEPYDFNIPVSYTWVKYNIDNSYEYRARVVRNPIGFFENYQAYYGYWNISEDESLLTHNKGMPYETIYSILTLNDTLFIREYDRVIYESQDTLKWKVGEMVTYREILEKRKGPCCD